MNVLYLVSRLRAGGPSNQLRNIVDNLDEQWDPVVLTLSPEEGETARPEFEKAGIPVHSLGLSRYAGLVLAPPRLRQFCRALNPAVVHSQGIRPDLLSSLFLAGRFRVATIRNYAFEDFRSKFGFIQGTLMAWLHLAALKRVEVPVACSETVQRKLVEHHDFAPAVVQNGVDAGTYVPAESDDKKRDHRQDLNLPRDRPVFISVGLLIARKDPKCVIQGFHRSSAANEGVLVMLGDGPLLEECKREAEAGAGDVRFPGFVENVALYLQAADYFISASRSEGLPNTVMEALGAGLPVLLSNIPSHSEILKRGAQAGRLFDLEDPIELARSIEALLCEDETELRAAARAVIEGHFNASRVSQEYQEIYQFAVR
ncbi:glycosyltransferase [Salinibacter ruber]|uniref:glycosyltransferase n=1 Tax=Salinibacter ruber TaxID=146919 RepID=UPI002167A400|nr:glycosyltransferase [Salinibacter ruber]